MKDGRIAFLDWMRVAAFMVFRKLNFCGWFYQ